MKNKPTDSKSEKIEKIESKLSLCHDSNILFTIFYICYFIYCIYNQKFEPTLFDIGLLFACISFALEINSRTNRLTIELFKLKYEDEPNENKD